MRRDIPLLLLALLATGAVPPAAAANVQPPPVMAGTGAAPLPGSFNPAVMPGQIEAPGCKQRHAKGAHKGKNDHMAKKDHMDKEDGHRRHK